MRPHDLSQKLLEFSACHYFLDGYIGRDWGGGDSGGRSRDDGDCASRRWIADQRYREEVGLDTPRS